MCIALAHVYIVFLQRVRLCRESGGGHVCQDQLHYHQGAGSCLPRLLRALAAARQQPQPQMAAQRPSLHPRHRPKERRGAVQRTFIPPPHPALTVLCLEVVCNAQVNTIFHQKQFVLIRPAGNHSTKPHRLAFISYIELNKLSE